MTDNENLFDTENNPTAGEPAPASFPAENSPPPCRENFFELLYGVLFTPAATFVRIARDRPLGPAVAVFLVAQALSAISAGFVAAGELPAAAVAALPAVLFPLSVLGGIAGWFLSAAVLHLLAEFFGGTGRGYNLFVTLGFTGLPGIFLAPVALFARGRLEWIYNLLAFAVFIWSVVLMVIAIRAVHRLSTGRAVLTLFVPFLVFLAFFITILLVMVFVFTSIAPSLPGYPFVP